MQIHAFTETCLGFKAKMIPCVFRDKTENDLKASNKIIKIVSVNYIFLNIELIVTAHGMNLLIVSENSSIKVKPLQLKGPAPLTVCIISTVWETATVRLTPILGPICLDSMSLILLSQGLQRQCLQPPHKAPPGPELLSNYRVLGSTLPCVLLLHN